MTQKTTQHQKIIEMQNVAVAISGGDIQLEGRIE